MMFRHKSRNKRRLGCDYDKVGASSQLDFRTCIPNDQLTQQMVSKNALLPPSMALINGQHLQNRTIFGVENEATIKLCRPRRSLKGMRNQALM